MKRQLILFGAVLCIISCSTKPVNGSHYVEAVLDDSKVLRLDLNVK